MKLMAKRAALLSTTLRTRSIEYKADLVKHMARDCLPHFESGALKVIIDSTYKLSELQ